MDSECNGDMLEGGSYQLVFGSLKNVDYKVQKPISNFQRF